MNTPDRAYGTAAPAQATSTPNQRTGQDGHAGTTPGAYVAFRLMAPGSAGHAMPAARVPPGLPISRCFSSLGALACHRHSQVPNNPICTDTITGSPVGAR